MACLTHYGTAPGPIFFGSGNVPLRTWWRLGLVISVVHLVIWLGPRASRGGRRSVSGEPVAHEQRRLLDHPPLDRKNGPGGPAPPRTKFVQLHNSTTVLEEAACPGRRAPLVPEEAVACPAEEAVAAERQSALSTDPRRPRDGPWVSAVMGLLDSDAAPRRAVYDAASSLGKFTRTLTGKRP